MPVSRLMVDSSVLTCLFQDKAAVAVEEEEVEIVAVEASVIEEVAAAAVDLVVVVEEEVLAAAEEVAPSLLIPTKVLSSISRVRVVNYCELLKTTILKSLN